MLRQFELVERVKSYDPNADEELINHLGLTHYGVDESSAKL